MPQLIAVMIAGAGLYAGFNWIAKTLERQTRGAARQGEGLQRRAAEAARVAKDLGALEYDPETQVYKPRGPRGPSRGAPA
jgi:hypothetical protein